MDSFTLTVYPGPWWCPGCSVAYADTLSTSFAVPCCPRCGTQLEEQGTGDDDPGDWPPHQPEAHDAPIPGRHWYSACEPEDYDSERGYYGAAGRVGPDGRCSSCGASACAECGRENCPDHQPPGGTE